MHFDEDILVLGYTGKQKEGQTEPGKMVWRCHRVTEKETPGWFEEQFEKAMVRPWL